MVEPYGITCTKEDKTRIESIQIEAMRIVTGATKLCSIAKLYEDTGWETLQTRRTKQRLLIFYKMIHGLTPNYLNNLVPPLVREYSQYSLRNARSIATLLSSTNLHYNSFLPSAIREWNNLSDEIRNSQSFLNFKSRLYSSRTRPPKYFNYGFRTLQVYHSRLRLECSTLNYHLFKKSIVASPNCTCGAIETPKHYLLTCPNYTAARNQVLTTYMNMPC